MKHLVLPLLAMTLVVTLTACGNETTSLPPPSESIPPPVTSPAATPGATNTPELQLEMSADTLQKLYAKAPGYDYMALGYYQDPFDPTMVRDGYVPFDEEYVQESTAFLRSEAHGVSIRLQMLEASTATEANKALASMYIEQLATRGISAQSGEISAFDNDTIAISSVTYQNEDNDAITTFLYLDIRGDGTVYMCAELEFNSEKFDDTTAALAAEVDDVYAANFSKIMGLS